MDDNVKSLQNHYIKIVTLGFPKPVQKLESINALQ